MVTSLRVPLASPFVLASSSAGRSGAEERQAGRNGDEFRATQARLREPPPLHVLATFDRREHDPRLSSGSYARPYRHSEVSTQTATAETSSHIGAKEEVASPSTGTASPLPEIRLESPSSCSFAPAWLPWSLLVVRTTAGGARDEARALPRSACLGRASRSPDDRIRACVLERAFRRR